MNKHTQILRAEHEANLGVPAETAVGPNAPSLRSGPSDQGANVPNAQQDTATTTPEPTHNTMDTRKFDEVEVAQASKSAPLTAYTFLGGEFGHKVEVVSELEENDGQTHEVLAEIAHRWNNHNDLLAALKAFADNVSDDEDDYPDYEAYKQAKRLEEQARAAIKNATPTT